MVFLPQIRTDYHDYECFSLAMGSEVSKVNDAFW